MRPATTEPLERPPAIPAPDGPYRLLGAGGPHRPLPLDVHRRTYPAPGAAGRPDRRIIEAVERSGLRGRGGAGFPTGRKLAAVADGSGRAVVVVNGSEGEPVSGKDRWLLSRAPHLVLDGAILAARAVGAREVSVAVERGSLGALRALERALDERRDEPSGHVVTVHGLPPRYVAGDESALVHWLDGGPAKPTTAPPRPFERGVGGKPTLVSNVETLAHLAQIVRWGPDWFRREGTPEHPGTVLATVGGAVRHPGVVEVGIGTPLVDLVRAAGGPTDGVQAILVGGYFGAWLPAADAAQASLSNESLRHHGAAIGCAAVTVLPRGACGVAESARVLAWFARESAGQCGSCVHGLKAIADGTDALLRPGAIGVTHLERWAAMVEGRGACHLPTGAVRFLRSALRTFATDIAAHRHGRPCPGAHQPPILPIPVVEEPMAWR